MLEGGTGGGIGVGGPDVVGVAEATIVAVAVAVLVGVKVAVGHHVAVLVEVIVAVESTVAVAVGVWVGSIAGGVGVDQKDPDRTTGSMTSRTGPVSSARSRLISSTISGLMGWMTMNGHAL